MAVPVQTPYQEYTANGVATSFAVAFQCLSKDTLIVTINGVEQSPTLWNLTGGNVVFVAAPANLAIVGIERSTALTREVTYQTYDNSFRPSVLNGDIDRLWHVLQENQLIYDKKVDKAAQIQTLGNLQGGGAIGLGLTLSLKDQTVTADYQFGSSIKIPVITLNQDGTVKSLHEVDMIGGGGGAFQIGWGDVLNKPTTLNGYGIIDAYTKSETYTKTEANTTFIEDSEKGAANGVATLDADTKVLVAQLPTATEVVTGVAKIATTAIARAGTNNTDFITAKKLKETSFAFGVDYGDVTAVRTINTVYRNDLPRTIVVRIAFFVSAQSTFTSLKVNNFVRDQKGTSTWSSNSFTSLSAEVPSGAEYKFEVASGSVSQIVWGEL